MPVELRNVQRKVRLDVRGLKRDVQGLLSALGYSEHLLSLLLTDDHRMREIHERWMGQSKSTDVLAFPMIEQIGSARQLLRNGTRAATPSTQLASGVPQMLGDVVISVETAKRRRPRTVQVEIRRYLIHGVLHLVGFDHVTKRDRLQMQRKSRRMLKVLG